MGAILASFLHLALRYGEGGLVIDDTLLDGVSRAVPCRASSAPHPLLVDS